MFEVSEAFVQRCSVQKEFLKILQNPQENTCARVSFLIKFQTLFLQLYLKTDSTQVFACGFCKIFKNTFFYRTPPVAASEISHHTKEILYVRGNLDALFHPGVRFRLGVKYFLFTCIFHPGWNFHSLHPGLNLIFCLPVKNSLFHPDWNFSPVFKAGKFHPACYV